MKNIYFILLIIFANIMSLSCKDEGDDSPRQARNPLLNDPILENNLQHENWVKLKIKNYSYQYKTTGFSLPSSAIVTVEDGSLSQVQCQDTSLDDDSELSCDREKESSRTIDQLFRDIEDLLLREESSKITITYNDEYYYPESVNIEQGEEESGYSVSNFNIIEPDEESAHVMVRVNAFENASIAQTVMINIDNSEYVYENQSAQSMIDLGKIKTQTKVHASVISADGSAKVDIVVDNCFRDSNFCDETGCNANAEYIVEKEHCMN